jgi:transposase-like protein
MSTKGFSREFKLAAIARIDSGEKVARVARDLGVARLTLYKWRDQLRRGGIAHKRGRPTTSLQSSGVLERVPLPELPAELVRARERIAELERKVGQQQVELDFFRGALRRIEASRQPSDGLGETESSPRSRR